jgi:threonylcarbamoyladenosine tRNA methylthiotransferase MtaB
MNTFSVETLGCKVNQYESQQITELLERLGLRVAAGLQGPDIAVVNTCCVTSTASAKSRQCIRKVRRKSPNALIIGCGCLPIADNGELGNIERGVIWVKDRARLADTIIKLVNGKSDGDGDLQLKPISSFKAHTRAFLKVQDGCDGYCSYCIVPKTRPVVSSCPIADIFEEAKQLVEAGYKEIVLTGVYLGAFGQNTTRRSKWPESQNKNLSELLDKVAQTPGLERIRLSSLEPGDVTETLLDVFCSHRNIMPHLHLSLQSGSDAVLKRMCRQYSRNEFLDKVSMVKQRLDRPAVTTDIIVGFPGETERCFKATVELAKQVGFSKMHVFRFSPRKGTAAASMKEKINGSIIKSRSEILRRLDAELGYNFRLQFIGRTEEVLVEGGSGSEPYGRSKRYFPVIVKDRTCRQNQIVKVKLIQNLPRAAVGEITV